MNNYLNDYVQPYFERAKKNTAEYKEKMEEYKQTTE